MKKLVATGVTIVFSCASLQIAAPLHASCCTGRAHEHDCGSGTSFELSSHDGENCPVCSFLFGVTGKTVLTEISADSHYEDIIIAECIDRQEILAEAAVYDFIPRAPPV